MGKSIISLQHMVTIKNITSTSLDLALVESLAGNQARPIF